MGLVVENGSMVPGANTYETIAGVTDYALNRGVTLAPDGLIQTASPYAGSNGGYLVGDVITPFEADASACTLSVVSIDEFGNPTAYEVVTGGINFSSANALPTMGGTGSGALVNLTANSAGIVIAASPYTPSVGGYVINDLLSVVQLNGGNGGVVKVAAVNGSGVPTAYTVQTPGASYLAGNGLLTSGGTGHGAQVNITVSFGATSVALVLACDYLESFSKQYVGKLVNFVQPLSWPRQCVWFDPCNLFPDDEIPPQLIEAQDEAVLVINSGIVLQPNTDYSQGGYKTESKVGPIITKYSEKIGTTTFPLMPKVVAKLATLLSPYPGPLLNVRL